MRRILPRTDLSVSANISDSDADKGDTTSFVSPFPRLLDTLAATRHPHVARARVRQISVDYYETLWLRDLPEKPNSVGGTTIRGLDNVMTIRTWFDRLQLWFEAIVSDIRKLLFPAAALSLRVRRGRNGGRVRKTLMPFASPKKRTFTRAHTAELAGAYRFP